MTPIFVLWITLICRTSRADFQFTNVADTLSSGFFSEGPESQIVSLFKSLLSNNTAASRVIDIGMNNGFYTLLAASRGATVLAFDPQPKCHSIMRDVHFPNNNDISSNITPVNVAIGPLGILHVSNITCDGFYAGEPSGVLNIMVLPLRTFLIPTIKYDLIKIDTEGAEIPILYELLNSFNLHGNICHVVVELIPRKWSSRGSTLQRGRFVLSQLQAISRNTYLLSDATPFYFKTDPCTSVLIDSSLALYTNFSIGALINDRYQQNCGCNLYFDLPC